MIALQVSPESNAKSQSLVAKILAKIQVLARISMISAVIRVLALKVLPESNAKSLSLVARILAKIQVLA